MKEKILVVDDEDTILRLVEYNLVKEGFEVLTSQDGSGIKERISAEKPDLLILDLMLPGTNGLNILRELRQEKIPLPVIILTAMGDETDRILGLEMGSDDYVTKPFSPRELVARVKAVLRRSSPLPPANLFAVEHLEVDIDQYEVRSEGRSVPLTPKEFELLVYMVRNQGRVLSRECLMENIWGHKYDGSTRVVDVHIRHLRDKIEKDPENPGIIRTVRGVGYRLSGKN
ncbi:MAG: response regulator transcription factor [Firmicutes bacterium]|nr:response regulator transcription factor [Bacillota bacterium]